MNTFRVVTSTRGLSKHADPQELAYHETTQHEEPKFRDHDAWLARIKDGRIERFRRAAALVGVRGRTLEVGAGSCWLTGEASKLPDTTECVALEFSERLLRDVAPGILSSLGADPKKITLMVGDFHDIDCPDGSFDRVLADAAIHHAGDLGQLLKECARVLRPDGVLIAIREPTLPDLPGLKETFRKKEHARHPEAHEQILSRREWIRAYAAAGLRCETIYTPGPRAGILARGALPFRFHSALTYVARKPARD